MKGDEHQRSPPRGPVHKKKNCQANGLARAEKQGSAGDDREGKRQRQSCADAVSNDSKENLAHGVKAKREAENDRCYGKAASDSEEIDNVIVQDVMTKGFQIIRAERILRTLGHVSSPSLP
jgi:predicted amidophosphoribosyltransferase